MAFSKSIQRIAVPCDDVESLRSTEAEDFQDLQASDTETVASEADRFPTNRNCHKQLDVCFAPVEVDSHRWRLVGARLAAVFADLAAADEEEEDTTDVRKWREGGACLTSASGFPKRNGESSSPLITPSGPSHCRWQHVGARVASVLAAVSDDEEDMFSAGLPVHEPDVVSCATSPEFAMGTIDVQRWQSEGAGLARVFAAEARNCVE